MSIVFQILLSVAVIPGASRPIPPPIEGVIIAAEDGVAVHGTYYPAYDARAIVLLFHQADSSRDEYASIAPRLAAAGFSALAIDQRSGGELFGQNTTVAELRRPATYLEARRDLEAALAWSRRMDIPVFLVGSSYSSALVLMLAADHPDVVAGVACFSPGEYFGQGDPVRAAALRVRSPALVITTAEEGEVLRSAPIVAALEEGAQELEVQALAAGKHGAATLIEAANPGGAQEGLSVLLRWLWRYTAPRFEA